LCARLCSQELRLFGHEKQSPHHELPDLIAFPPRLHNSLVRVAVRAKQQMAEFVGYGATQNYWELELSIVTLGATQSVLVIDTGENRMDCKTEDIVLELILNGHSEHPQPDVGSFGRFLARFPAG
jgi:hypothetical protein